MPSITLPGLNCGLCGVATCAEFADRLATKPELLKRCIHLENSGMKNGQPLVEEVAEPLVANPSEPAPAPVCAGCRPSRPTHSWHDSLGREFDFILRHFPEEPGPREIILPHNPMITREMDIQVGDILIGRPLGMSCGCPITHCGVVMSVDHRTGVIVWCVTGPLRPRQGGFKDVGYYIAEGYEGLIKESRCEIKIGMRYFFQPEMCMLQWRHSGLVNYLSRTGQELQVRVEGLWIG